MTMQYAAEKKPLLRTRSVPVRTATLARTNRQLNDDSRAGLERPCVRFLWFRSDDNGARARSPALFACSALHGFLNFAGD